MGRFGPLVAVDGWVKTWRGVGGTVTGVTPTSGSVFCMPLDMTRTTRRRVLDAVANAASARSNPAPIEVDPAGAIVARLAVVIRGWAVVNGTIPAPGMVDHQVAVESNRMTPRLSSVGAADPSVVRMSAHAPTKSATADRSASIFGRGALPVVDEDMLPEWSRTRMTSIGGRNVEHAFWPGKSVFSTNAPDAGRRIGALPEIPPAKVKLWTHTLEIEFVPVPGTWRSIVQWSSAAKVDAIDPSGWKS